MTLSLHFVAVSLLTTAAGAAMIRLGIGKGLLNARAATRRCTSCGRRFDGSRCPSCSPR